MFGKHLKIVEQIAIVFVFAVVIPMSISAFVINNVNQQAIRLQLRESAVLVANMVSDEIDFFNKTVTNNLEQIAFSLNYFKTPQEKKAYLKSVVPKLHDCENLEIVDTKGLEKIRANNKIEKKAIVPLKISDDEYLVATYALDAVKDELFKSLKDDKRQIYVLGNDGDLVAEHNYTDEAFKNTISLLPKKLKKDEPIIFGDVKNQPLVYVSKDDPKITIIVNTTKKLTQKAITNNSLKIFLSCLFATLAIIFVIGLYTYYLYINIRQLFKGIIAISKGNYERQIRLLTTAFTPHEIIFLASEFNHMATEIHKSYIQLKKNNVELKQLNEFRSNLIDTVSHELRTPLTSIQGYTTRLMRQDIVIDEETKQKSLRIIKEQSERLKRMIEDLLTIPDIEGMRLRTNVEEVWIPEILEESRILIRNKEQKEIVFNISEDFPTVLADKDRLLQVFVNLLENGAKYASENSKIVVDKEILEDKVKLFFKNDCDVIPPAKLKRLFGKFIRLDDKTTRTTRGTGLGLYIVKGLIEAMNGEIELHSDENCGFCVEITLRRA
jgi:signal transduction histidine kinase